VDVTKLTDKARIATERGNYDYAIDLYLRLLDLQPKDIDARKALRAVEMRKFQDRGVTKSTASGWIKGFGQLIAALIHMLVHKYEKAMGACEVFLKNDPYNRSVLCLLARAAIGAEYPEVAIQIYEEVRGNDGAPAKGMALAGHIRVLRKLGDLYTQTEQLPLAAERIEQILKIRPGDREAERLIRNIAAQRSMVEGGWDKAGKQGGYREVLKDGDSAKRLEDTHRDIRTREDVLGAIARVSDDLKGDPDNTRFLVQLGDLYKSLKQWDDARAQYERGHQIDPTNFMIVERIGDLKLAEMDEQIGAMKGDASRKDELKALYIERMKFALVEYQKRVKARPQDLPTRFALGKLLLQIGKHKEASVQFQHAARDPKTRRPALYRLGLCFQQQGMVDLAIEQFERAVKGSSLVDQEVKDILYSLGEAHESQGRLSEALEAYKRIFEVDLDFKDVSTKIEELFKKGAKSES